MKNSLTLYLGLFALICLVSAWILHQTYVPSSTMTKNGIANFLVHAASTEFNEAGLIKSKLTADRITHFDENERTTFENPTIILYPADRTSPWNIQANSGESDAAGDTLWLNGTVIIHQVASVAHPETTITTDTVTVFPKKSIAISEAPTTIVRPGTTIHGRGFTANLKTGEYTLLSESNADYQPPPKA